jgi:Spy/CpxP family protein refolding chaperone
MLAGRKKMMLALLGCTLLACSLLLSKAAMAQGHPGGGGGGQGGGNPGGGQGGGRNDGGRGGDGGGQGMPGMSGQMQGAMGGRGGVPVGVSNASRGGMRGGAGSLQTGPVGRWWDDKSYSNALGLRTEQRKKMDAIFNENRGELTSRYQALRTEESKLEEATRDSKVSQGSVFGQIDRVAQARDALEKTNARLMGELRKELDADQTAKMQALK